jgi:hypothetical protein
MTASNTPGGKGSAPRPIPDPQKFSDNWDQIFGKKDKKPEEDKKHENSD